MRYESLVKPAKQNPRRAFRKARVRIDLSPAGDAGSILARIAEYRAAGITKFVLRPMAENARELEEQTRRLDAEVVPAL